MRIVFMGTPDFAVPSLKALVEHHHEILAVYSQPDKPKGRGHKLQPTPVKEYALTQGLTVCQPQKVREETVISAIRELAPDCIVVVAYGKMLPKAILDIPKYGCINVHGSLLPKYRGAAPIQWAVLNGEKTTGITTMYMGEGMDTGDMLLTCETPIGDQETSGQLFDRLKELGAQLLVETLEQLPDIQAKKQDEALVTMAPLITKEHSAIDWTMPAEKIHNQIRGLNPWPSAVAMLDGVRLKLFGAEILSCSGAAGAPFVQDGELCIYCGEGALKLTELQPENGKRMTGKSYLAGHPLGTGY